MITLPEDHDNEVDLAKLNYRFSISNIDQTKGVIKVNHVSWPKGGNKIKTPIEVVDCALIQDDS